ncbi:MAG: hypothetical protein J6W05_03775, partial [Prevotella sp.]|nr:hypothetical protein [Prevotella sp.]
DVPAIALAFSNPCDDVPAIALAFSNPCDDVPAIALAFSNPCDDVPRIRGRVFRKTGTRIAASPCQN